MDDGFSVSERPAGDLTVVTVVGEIDLATVPDVRSCLAAAEERPFPLTVMDLSQVTFMDSTALGVVVEAYRSRRDRGEELRLVVTHSHVLKVFEITNLSSVIPIFGSLAEAMEG